MSSVSEALKLVEEIEDIVENDLPYEALEFGEDTLVTARGIAGNIEQYERVTPNQFRALVNIREGLLKWVRK